MSFKIAKSHKYVQQFPSSDAKSSSSLLENEYLLFGIDENLGSKAECAQSKPHVGGNHIRQTDSAQADFY